MNDHHLILGRLTDYLTGKRLDDTLDERYRQKLARHLVEHCGFARPDITARFKLKVNACGRQALIPIDFLVAASGKTGMLVKYGPGSLVTRHNPAIAASRIARPYQIPVVVITNGEDADILDSQTGKLIGTGFQGIPGKSDLAERCAQHRFDDVPTKMVEMAHKIIYAFEVDGSCPCDTDICRLP